MGFDVEKALDAADKARKIGGDVADKAVETYNKVADGNTARKIQVDSHKTDNVLRYIDAAEQALSTVVSVYATISQSINATKEIKNKIQESREKFELDKQKLEQDFEEMKRKYQLEEQNISQSHEEKMESIRARHEEEMLKIATVRELVMRQMDVLTGLAPDFPNLVPPFILQISNCLSSIKTSSNNLLEG